MSKSAFAQTIISKLKSAIGTTGGNYSTDTATSAMAGVASGITEYLIANTQVQISYAGIIPGTPTMPDPVVTDVFQIVGSCAPTGPSSSFDSWIKQIEANIIAGFSLAPLGSAGVAFPTKPFANPGISVTRSILTSSHDVSDTDPQQKVWEIICGGIMDWINGPAMNAASGTATHTPPGSSGPAQITKITIA